jgi:hypothetical protein
MDNFSPVHWIITLALVGALGAFVYFVGSLLWAGAKVKGKGKLVAAAVLLPLAVLALIGFMGASKAPEPQAAKDAEWWKVGEPVN